MANEYGPGQSGTYAAPAVLDEQVIKTGAAAGAGAGTGALGMIAGGALSVGSQMLGDWLNRRWQTKMANTAHQREVADLRKAGLNPILTAMGGRGAAVPSASVGDMTGLGSGVSSASRLAGLEKQMMISNIALNDAKTVAARADAARVAALTPEAVKLVQAQTAERAASAKTMSERWEVEKSSPGELRKWLPPDWIQKSHDWLENLFGPSKANRE